MFDFRVGMPETMKPMITFRAMALAFAPAALALSGCDQPVQSGSDAAQTQPGRDLDETAGKSGESVSVPPKPTGKVIDIQMFTDDPDNPGNQHVFKPRLVMAEVGDTIRFIPTETSHQSSSIETMLPEGVRGWEGAINEEITYLLPKPGIYGYQCIPHYAAGMVGLVIVKGPGKTDNLEMALRSGHPGLGVPEFAAIFEEAMEKGLLSPETAGTVQGGSDQGDTETDDPQQGGSESLPQSR